MPFSFLTGSLLFGLVLAGLPVLVHLISRRRARRVEFAAMEFVLKSQKRTARNLRLRQFLLLLVRTLLVTALALAVTRPLWKKSASGGDTKAPLAVMYILDVSGSMRATLDGASAHNRATRAIRDRLDQLPPDVRAGLIACGAAAREISAPVFDRAKLLSALKDSIAEYGTSDLVACISNAQQLAAQVTGAGERRIVVVSDLAAHALNAPSSLRASKDLVVEWVSTWGSDVPPNHGLFDVEIERSDDGGSDALAVRFSAARFGAKVDDLAADLIVNNERVSRVTLNLDDGQTEDRTFTYSLGDDVNDAEREGWVAQVRLDDDALDADNHADLPIDLPPPVRVLVVDGAPQPIPFRDEVFYLESALKNAKSARAKISLNVVGTDQVTESALAESRVVLLANVSRLDPVATKALTDFVRAGGGLLLTMGDQVDPTWTNTALGEVLPGKLRGTKGQALLDNADVAEALGLGRFAKGHPVLSGLSLGSDRGLSGLSRVQTTILMLLEPDATAERDVLVRFTNGAPALVERKVDRGRVLLWNTTIDRDWSDFAIRPGFLPLVEQMILYLGGALEERAAGIVEVGTARRVPFPRGAKMVVVENPNKKRTRYGEEDAQQPEGDEDGRAKYLAFDATTVPGIYRIFVGTSDDDLRELTKDRFSVVFPRSESNLTPADESRLEEGAPKGATVRGQGATGKDSPLWPLLLLAAAALLFIESFMLRKS